jgi:hypothetical protein
VINMASKQMLITNNEKDFQGIDIPFIKPKVI